MSDGVVQYGTVSNCNYSFTVLIKDRRTVRTQVQVLILGKRFTESSYYYTLHNITHLYAQRSKPKKETSEGLETMKGREL